MLSFENGFTEVAMLLAIVTVIAAIGRLLRQLVSARLYSPLFLVI